MRRWLLVIGLVALGASRAGADTIQEIVVEDNEKTTSDTVELIAKVEVGDDWTPAMVDLIKTRLVTSGLFKDVEVFYEPVAGGVRLHMLVRDKHSWVIAPAFYTQPTNVGGGVGFGENNLFGLDQKLLIYAQIATGDTYFVGAWVIPTIGGTRFYAQVDTYDKHSRSIEYAAPTRYLSNPLAVRRAYTDYYNAGLRVGYDIYRGLKLDTRLRAAYVSYSHVELDTQDNLNVTAADASATDPANIPAPGISGWDVSNEITLTLDHRANWYGIASGGKYTLTFEHSVLNSDFHYYELNASAYKAWPVFESHNFVLKAHADVGHHMPFQQEFLTGGTSMRGWLNNQFRGDVRGLVNAEYSVPLFEIEGLQFRGIGFWDSAYTTFLSKDNPERNYLPNSAARGLSPFKNSVGVGTRLFLRQIVLPLLGLDFGYGLEAHQLEIYLAIGLTD
ncbi:MAG TPA: BamA/TamA family outer membrane protein [Kofleriaceae bacterium]